MGQAKGLQEMSEFNSCAVIMAHPDDETLWAGGTILMHPEANWTVITLCSKNDPHRSHRFFKAIEKPGAAGAMGDINDGPRQRPMDGRDVKNMILKLIPSERFDLIISHGPSGEYKRHLRGNRKCSNGFMEKQQTICRGNIEVRLRPW